MGAIGYYTYYQRVEQGLRQLMAGARKFATKYIDLTDLAALTPEAHRISGIELVTDMDREEAETILCLVVHCNYQPVQVGSAQTRAIRLMHHEKTARSRCFSF